MCKYWLVALSLLLCATPAAARDRVSDRNMPSSNATPDAAPPSAPLTDRYTGPGPSSARIPLVSNMDVGVGLYSVGGHFVRDRQTNGREPIQGTSGRDNRVAAVGLSLRF
jgi:hypothetical protein